jgi:CRP/FNR family transcriptional regulator, cyclic AMP receptor protein
MQGLERIVLDQPFFAGLGPEFGAAISGCARNLRFAAGEYLFREGEPANEFYLLRQGSVALELHSPGQQPLVVRPYTKATFSTGRGWCRPIAGHLMRAVQTSSACLGSTHGACETNARPTMISATS